MTSSSYDFSVVVPIFNNRNSLVELTSRIAAVFFAREDSFEIICVSDGSYDGSWEVLQEIKKTANYPLKLVKLSQNYGQHKALACGMGFSSGQSVILIDADLQIPPEEIPKLIEEKERSKAEVVYGLYHQKQHNPIRNKGSALLGKILRKFGTFQAKGSAFKLIDRRVVLKVCQTNFEYIFIDELLGWHTSRFAYTPIVHLPRTDGESSYSMRKLILMALKIIFNYTTLPLTIMTYSGLLVGVVCFFLALYFIFMKFVYGATVGFTAIIVTILFSTGVLLFCLGIIGEYMRKLYFVQLSKPSFTVSEVID